MMDAKAFRAAATRGTGAGPGAGAGTEAGAAAEAKEAKPPEGLSPALRALWHLARDEWDAAHGAARSDGSRDGAWVHAHLHRVEGDLANAGYWYRRADRPASEAPLADEWEEIAAALLADP